jgi:hypothetical protein
VGRKMIVARAELPHLPWHAAPVRRPGSGACRDRRGPRRWPLGALTYKSVASILENNLDRTPQTSESKIIAEPVLGGLHHVYKHEA